MSNKGTTYSCTFDLTKTEIFTDYFYPKIKNERMFEGVFRDFKTKLAYKIYLTQPDIDKRPNAGVNMFIPQ